MPKSLWLLIGHVISTRIEFAFTGIEATYPTIVQNFWVRSPVTGAQHVVALLIAWLHFCLGLFFWLRTKRGFAAWRLPLFALAVLVPVLAALGFTQAGKEVAGRPLERSGRQDPVPGWVEPGLVLAFAGPIVVVLAMRLLRGTYRRRDRVRVGYPDGRSVDTLKRIEGAGRTPEAVAEVPSARARTLR